MSKSKIVIYTVKSESIIWIFEVISSAFWILKEEKETIDVEIIILEDPNISSTKNLLKYFIKLTYININKSLIKSLINFFFSKSWKRKIIKFLEEPFIKNSIYNQINLNQKVFFKHDNINFTIKNSNFINFPYGILIKIKAQIISSFIFFYYKFLKTPKMFLKLKFNDILIGDIIASTFLRNNPKNAGSFKLSIPTYNLLTKAIYCELKSKYNKSYFLKYSSYLILPEPTYLQVLWKRTFIKYGVIPIETHSYKSKFSLNNDLSLDNPWIASKKEIIKISENEKNSINDFFYTRLNNPQKIMAYLTKENSNKNNEKQIYNLENEIIDFKKNKRNESKELVAVIFLHSFDDAQYCFGIDDFTDIYEWTIFSIESCLANNEFDHILIKPHPGLDYNIFPGDRIAFNKLYKKFNDFEKISFIKKDSSIVYLSQIANIVGLTHHGSVAEELIYLNQNAIGYVGGMWSNHYKFLSTWKTKNQYTDIINSFNKNNFNIPSDSQKEHLSNYIIERKLNSVDLRKYSIRLLLSKKIDVFKHWDFNDYGDAWLRFNNDTKLICNDNLFKNKILKILRDQAKMI